MELKQDMAQSNPTSANVEIVYYTDPLCCWSWAFEPQWRKLRYLYRHQLQYQYVMGGLLPNWDTFTDPLNNVSRPVQMGPLWFEAKHISGMPVNDRIWMLDPPTSSYPACIAVKCAGLQSVEAEERYLRRLREAVMLHTKNIAQQNILLDVAAQVADEMPNIFDLQKFAADLKEGTGNVAFTEDLKRTSYHKIGRFPTLTITRKGARGIMIVGYRPFHVLMQAIKAIAPDLQPIAEPISKEDYITYWHGALDREVAEMQDTYMPVATP